MWAEGHFVRSVCLAAETSTSIVFEYYFNCIRILQLYSNIVTIKFQIVYEQLQVLDIMIISIFNITLYYKIY